MYSNLLVAAIVGLGLGALSMVLAFTKRKDRIQCDRFGSVAQLCGLLTITVTVIAAVYHFRMDHDSDTEAPMRVFEFFLAHPALFVIAISSVALMFGRRFLRWG